MARVVHFEIHADDPARAANFYQSIFGWEITKWEGVEDYWLVTTGPANEPGINGAILRRHLPITVDPVPVAAYICTLDVSSLEESLEAVVAHGGVIALPKMPVEKIGWLAYAKDSEGNIFGMMQADPNATA